jgi:hypothetical protein
MKKRISKKVLNRMAKYCQLTGLRFGQLIANMTCNSGQFVDGLAVHQCPQAIEDSDLEKLFNEYRLKNPPPPKDRGGYFPHGHFIHTPEPEED